MANCFYNPKSRNYKPSKRRTSEIDNNLRRRKLIGDGNSSNRNEEVQFSFMTFCESDIYRRWFLDSGCSRHLTNQRRHMFDYRPLTKAEYVSAAYDGGNIRIFGIGNLRVRQIIDGKEIVMILKDVRFAPKCRTNLVPLTKAQRAGASINFRAVDSKFTASHNGKVVMVGDSKATGIAELTGMVSVSEGKSAMTFFTAGEDDTMQLAHRRTCHTSISTFRKMESTNAVRGLGDLKSAKKVRNICEACVEGKATNNPHTPRSK